jgi:hypothetical protein
LREPLEGEMGVMGAAEASAESVNDGSSAAEHAATPAKRPSTTPDDSNAGRFANDNLLDRFLRTALSLERIDLRPFTVRVVCAAADGV